MYIQRKKIEVAIKYRCYVTVNNKESVVMRRRDNSCLIMVFDAHAERVD